MIEFAKLEKQFAYRPWPTGEVAARVIEAPGT